MAAQSLAITDAFAETILVDSVPALHAAVNSANNSGGDTIILVADGTYTLNDTLYINVPNVTISSDSGVRENVVIQGDAMSATANIGNLIRVAARNFKLQGVTLQKSRWHLIQIVGESDADSPEIRDCILRDAYEQMIKVSVDQNDLNTSADNGLVENCLFEYTAGIGPQYYIGGIDAHAAKNWIVRGNTFRNIISPDTAVAEYAVHFWNDSADNLVEKNLIINCDRGIGFGLNSRGNRGGTIQNNMIYHANNRGAFADVGIALHNSPDTRVYNNTILMEHNYPSSIEYRFPATTNVDIRNNLANRNISQINGATGTVSNNILNAQSNWFKNAAAGDLHLANESISAIGQGEPLFGLVDDFDGDARTDGASIDVGADEFKTTSRPLPPTDLLVN
ncbi:MAG: right-handed parallel beta-helix repeat-containing protein [Calditrichaeota bacterium]|nr:right-handed parallel beta-helix repeat-containing protein [Calditrichota bacterium]